jgi:hypothetical protein
VNEAVVRRIDEERRRQDQRWGTDHDDGHQAATWLMLLAKYQGRLAEILADCQDCGAADVMLTEDLAKLVAVGVAWLEVMARAGTPTLRDTDDRRRQTLSVGPDDPLRRLLPPLPGAVSTEARLEVVWRVDAGFSPRPSSAVYRLVGRMTLESGLSFEHAKVVTVEHAAGRGMYETLDGYWAAIASELMAALRKAASS